MTGLKSSDLTCCIAVLYPVLLLFYLCFATRLLCVVKLLILYVLYCVALLFCCFVCFVCFVVLFVPGIFIF